MKKILVATLFAFSMMTTACFAATSDSTDTVEKGSIADTTDTDITGAAVIEGGSIIGIKDDDIEYTRGCCSHHSGVSYCDSSVGRLVCNDGTYSPSCGC